jgi:hypothetical protein
MVMFDRAALPENAADAPLGDEAKGDPWRIIEVGFVDTRTFVFKESTMTKTRPPYPPEFRRQMVELVRAGRSPEELAQEFEPTARSIRNWVGQAECDAGRGAQLIVVVALPVRLALHARAGLVDWRSPRWRARWRRSALLSHRTARPAPSSQLVRSCCV